MPDHTWLVWNGGTVLKLDQSAYEERHLPGGTLDIALLGILADASQDAGCCNREREILDHLLAQVAMHVRGCWVVDLLLTSEREQRPV